MVLVITCDKDWRDFAAHYFLCKTLFQFEAGPTPQDVYLTSMIAFATIL
jgi:hypothetical protein